MNITEQQLALAAKALGVEWLRIDDNYHPQDAVWHSSMGRGDDDPPVFGPGFAEFAVPVLEERHDIDIDIWLDCMTKEESGYGNTWTVRTNHCPDVTIHGPDIDTAVFLLAAKIGEGME